MEVTATPTELDGSDSLSLHVEAENRTRRTLQFSTNGCVFMFEMLDRAGERVRLFPGACNDIYIGHEILPGGTLEWTVDLPLRSTDGTSRYETMPPGEYAIYAGVSMDMRARTGPVWFRVR